MLVSFVEIETDRKNPYRFCPYGGCYKTAGRRMSHRIGRLELLIWFVVSILGSSIILLIVGSVTNTAIVVERTRYPLSQALCLILATVVILKAVVSRFHDIGWSGWAVIVMFVPLVDIAVLLLLLVVPGQKRPNLYGEPPIFLRRFRKLA
jgi:uncharacterized membrane protein YhaH (DUF805 family)